MWLSSISKSVGYSFWEPCYYCFTLNLKYFNSLHLVLNECYSCFTCICTPCDNSTAATFDTFCLSEEVLNCCSYSRFTLYFHFKVLCSYPDWESKTRGCFFCKFCKVLGEILNLGWFLLHIFMISCTLPYSTTENKNWN